MTIAGRRAASEPVDRPEAAVLGFWREAGERGKWFDKDEDFDRAFRDRFIDLHLAVAARRHDDWMASPHGALALVILADQFPRNAFRGTVQMYATDPLARHFAREAFDAGHMERVEKDLRLFFCLPFSHSEDTVDQDLSVRLNATLDQPWLDHARGHQDIIRRFGRFPHRNAVLGRATTPDEADFLRQGGFNG